MADSYLERLLDESVDVGSVMGDFSDANLPLRRTERDIYPVDDPVREQATRMRPGAGQGWLGGFARASGPSPFTSRGAGAGGLLAALLTGVGNYVVNDRLADQGEVRVQNAADRQSARDRDQANLRITLAARALANRRHEARRAAAAPVARPVAQKPTLDEEAERARVLAEARAAGAAAGKPPEPPKPAKPLSAGQQNELVTDADLIRKTAEIRKLHRPEFTGPVRSLKGAVRTGTGRGQLEGEATFRAAVANYRNAAIRAIAGSNVTLNEKERMKQEVPDTGNPTETFLDRLTLTEKNLRSLATLRRNTFSEAGHDLSKLSPLPGDEPAGAAADSLSDEDAWNLLQQMRAKRKPAPKGSK